MSHQVCCDLPITGGHYSVASILDKIDTFPELAIKPISSLKGKRKSYEPKKIYSTNSDTTEVYLTADQQELNGFNDSVENLLLNHENILGKRQIERIGELEEDSELDPMQEGVNFESLKGYIKFLKKYHVSTDPVIGLTNNGRLYASWRKSSCHKLSIEVIDENRLLYVAIYGDGGSNDESAKKEIYRLDGLVSEPEIFELLYSK